MKLFLCLSILLLADYALGKNCKEIKPTNPSDCVLSKEDKKTYKYCCYEKTILGTQCYAYTQSMKDIIDELMEEYENTEDIFICNTSSSYIKLGFLLIISFIIY